MFVLHLALVLIVSIKVLCLPICYQLYGICFPPILYSANYFTRVNFYLHACKYVCLAGDMHMSIGAWDQKKKSDLLAPQLEVTVSCLLGTELGASKPLRNPFMLSVGFLSTGLKTDFAHEAIAKSSTTAFPLMFSSSCFIFLAPLCGHSLLLRWVLYMICSWSFPYLSTSSITQENKVQLSSVSKVTSSSPGLTLPVIWDAKQTWVAPTFYLTSQRTKINQKKKFTQLPNFSYDTDSCAIPWVIHLFKHLKINNLTFQLSTPTLI